jgi:type II secretory pathway component GspD/PulD (secretin)
MISDHNYDAASGCRVPTRCREYSCRHIQHVAKERSANRTAGCPERACNETKARAARSSGWSAVAGFDRRCARQNRHNHGGRRTENRRPGSAQRARRLGRRSRSRYYLAPRDSANMAIGARTRPTRVGFALACLAIAGNARGQDSTVTLRGDSVVIRLVDVDVRSAVSMLARYLDRPVTFGNIQGGRVTLESPRPVHQRDVYRMVRALVEGQNLEIVLDSAAGVYRVRSKETPRPAPQPPTPMQRGGAGGPPELFVVRLRHARAADVAATVNALYGRAAALGELGAPPSTLGQELRQNMIPPVGAPPPQAAACAVGRVASKQGEMTIVTDQGTTALLVRASRADFELIEAAVKEIDVRPLQVLIEVVIAEVRKDRALSLGIDGHVGPRAIPGVPGRAVSGTLGQSVGLSDLVLKVMNTRGTDAEVVLRAAASRGDVRIVSRPVVLAANNQSADITVGSQRPFVQVQRSLPTDAAQRDQIVQYKDVGTQLTVKPTISADGYVMLHVTQQVNQATSETQFDAPIISTRSVQTQLLVKDGQTVVLGGISDRQRDVKSSGLPILSRIPVLGGLFGGNERRTSETELFLFLKPVVLFTDEDTQRETDPLRKRAGVEKTP